MEWILDPQMWIGLLTLTALEIVLGIDNIVFISILAGKLPPDQQAKARQTGLSLALITRVLLLCGGDKRKQSADIKRAVEYWSDYQQRTASHE